MADVVRLAIDVVVEKGDPSDVAEVLYNERERIAKFATAVVLKEDEKTAEGKSVAAAGNSHIHDPEKDGGRCNECVRYSGRALLSRVESFSG